MYMSVRPYKPIIMLYLCIFIKWHLSLEIQLVYLIFARLRNKNWHSDNIFVALVSPCITDIDLPILTTYWPTGTWCYFTRIRNYESRYLTCNLYQKSIPSLFLAWLFCDKTNLSLVPCRTLPTCIMFNSTTAIYFQWSHPTISYMHRGNTIQMYIIGDVRSIASFNLLVFIYTQCLSKLLSTEESNSNRTLRFSFSSYWHEHNMQLAIMVQHFNVSSITNQ